MRIMSNGLSFGLQAKQDLIGSITSPVTLTTNYTDNTKNIVAGGESQHTVYVSYTAAGVGNSIQIKVEGSPDSVDSMSPSFYLS